MGKRAGGGRKRELKKDKIGNRKSAKDEERRKN